PLRPDQIDQLRKALTAAETHGFAHEAFTPPNLDALLQSQNPDARRSGEAALTTAILRYAHAVHSGRLSSAAFMDEWGLRPAAYDPTPDFTAAVNGDRIGAWLDSLPPPYTGYQALRTALATYRGIAARGGWDPIQAGPDLKLGVKDPRVAELRARLAFEDPAVAAAPAPKVPTLFDQPLAEAVMRAQKRYGQDPDGVVRKATLAALNRPVEDRVAQILANMERWRWLPPTLPTDRVQVNIAAAILTVFHDDAPILSMRAVTGRPKDETPMLQSQIQSIVLNPPWNVPPSIAAKELWPKERAHPGYFKRNDFIIIRTPEGGERLQQKAGRKAALGRIKFDFPNRYGVYLHDTPTHSTFGRLTRQVSHGCVRLEKPLDLANTLFAGDTHWTPEEVQSTLDGGDTVRAQLSKPIAVFLFYWTAFVGPDGLTNFRADPYDWDNALMQRIAA
ncbi:MAG: L,D-transpeptidase family protein, partial [Caulobacteraceae bacterium]|nr:L,D-transpeptidase family protein [Caulobacteraceae bacterium]